MKYFRFYYFSFLYFYKDKPESWIAEYRSLFLVSITITNAVTFILLTIYPNFKGIYPYAKLIIVALFIILCTTMQRLLISTHKYRLIFEEFKDHPLNTKLNRVICWLIWLISFTAPAILAIIQMGTHR